MTEFNIESYKLERKLNCNQIKMTLYFCGAPKIHLIDLSPCPYHKLCTKKFRLRLVIEANFFFLKFLAWYSFFIPYICSVESVSVLSYEHTSKKNEIASTPRRKYRIHEKSNNSTTKSWKSKQFEKTIYFLVHAYLMR